IWVETDGSFPILYMFPIDSDLGFTQNYINVRFYCLDRIIRDRTNYNTIISDCHRCLNDLYKFLQSPNVSLIDDENEPSLIPLNDTDMAYLGGWYMDLRIDLDTYSDCFIMVDGKPTFEYNSNINFVKYLTCDNINNCDVINKLIEDVNYLLNLNNNEDNG